jgi:retinol dehydrogenase-12
MFQTAAIYTSLLSLTYVVVLHIFRVSVYENENIFGSILESCICVILLVLGWNTDKLSGLGHAQSFVGIFIAAISGYYAYRMHQYYVAGTKYKPTNLDDKVYIITGSNTGLGFETAKQIVIQGGTVVMACRSVDKAKIAREKIISITKCAPTKVFVQKLDLCGFDSVRKFVKEFRGLSLPLHGLINNAGVMMQDRSLTQDGFETVFTANHLSHFLLTNLLLPDLEKTNGRVTNVASSLHKSLTEFNFDDVMSER